MTKNLRITVGCLAVLTLLLVFGVTIWWIPRQQTEDVPGFQGQSSPPSQP